MLERYSCHHRPMTRRWESKGTEFIKSDLSHHCAASLCQDPFSVHVFIAWWEQSQHTRADCVFARLQPTTRLHQVSSRGRTAQVDKSSTFQINRDCSWNWPLQEKWAHKTYEKVPGIAQLSGKPGAKRHLGECLSLCTWGGQVPSEPPLSMIIHL